MSRPTIDDLRQRYLTGLGPEGRERFGKGIVRGRAPAPRGYADRPGTGPEGERCGTCRHREAVELGNRYWKCGLMRERWTGGPATDIRLKSPACSKWERKETER